MSILAFHKYYIIDKTQTKIVAKKVPRFDFCGISSYITKFDNHKSLFIAYKLFFQHSKKLLNESFHCFSQEITPVSTY